MSTHSTDGKEWAKYSELHPGDKIRTDDGFTCGIRCQILEVGKDELGLYVNCHDGNHYLDGQMDKDGDHLIGIWPDAKISKKQHLTELRTKTVNSIK